MVVKRVTREGRETSDEVVWKTATDRELFAKVLLSIRRSSLKQQRGGQKRRCRHATWICTSPDLIFIHFCEPLSVNLQPLEMKHWHALRHTQYCEQPWALADTQLVRVGMRARVGRVTADSSS